MGKTVGSILQLGVGIAALAVGPGGIARGLAQIGVSGGLASALGAAIYTTAVSAGSSGANTLFGKSPPAETTVTALKTERPPRVSGYGRSKTHAVWEEFT